MKFYFQIFLSIVLGSLLGIAMYNKLTTKNDITQASDVATDLSLLADNIDFVKIKREADSLAYIKYQDSLQRAILFVEKEPKQPEPKAVVQIAKSEIVIKPKVAVQSKLEVQEIKKKNIISIPANTIPAPEKIEVATLKTAIVIEAETPVTDGAAQSQPQVDKKKKFLFFNKKNNAN